MREFFPGRMASFLLALVPLYAAATETGPSDNAPAWRYTVKPGDTLIAIAERYLARSEQWPKIQKANRIADPHRILPGTVLSIPAMMLRKEPGAARLEDIHGAVRWRPEGEAWQIATEGIRLAAGSSVETADDSSALLVLADGSRIVVSPRSLLVLDSLSLYAGGLMVDTRLHLKHGKADIEANPERRPQQHFKIRTPAAQAVVRGTRFRVAADGQVMREETLAGRVDVGAGGRDVSVVANQGTVVSAGQPPLLPVPLLPAGDLSRLAQRFEHLPMRFELPSLTGAVMWQGQISSDEAFRTILLDRAAHGNHLTFPDLPNGNYVLRLRAIDTHGLQGRDALHRFTVFARPFPPGLNLPGDGAVVRTARPHFAWGRVVDTVSYRFQVSADADFASLLHDQETGGASAEVSDDLPPGPLHWRVASVAGDGAQGPWSKPATFVYKPGPGPTDLGKAALEIDGDTLVLALPSPPSGLHYEATLAADRSMQPPLARARGDGGRLVLAGPGGGSFYLGVRLVDSADGTPGPETVQKIDVPAGNKLLILLLPLLLLL